MRSFKHWTPRYLCDRFRVFVYQKTHPDAPWLTKRAIEILSSWLRPSDIGLEWGSGRSTVWFARRVARLVSVEDDAGWFKRVTAMLERDGLSRLVDYRLARDDASYIGVASDIRGGVDFCLVDGVERTRDACALAALPLLRPGGLLILDNSDWFLPNNTKTPHSHYPRPSSQLWKQFIEAVAGWRSINTTNGVWDTTFWIKPNGE
jgi:hypothetical protein